MTLDAETFSKLTERLGSGIKRLLDVPLMLLSRIKIVFFCASWITSGVAANNCASISGWVASWCAACCRAGSARAEGFDERKNKLRSDSTRLTRLLAPVLLFSTTTAGLHRCCCGCSNFLPLVAGATPSHDWLDAFSAKSAVGDEHVGTGSTGPSPSPWCPSIKGVESLTFADGWLTTFLFCSHLRPTFLPHVDGPPT